MARINILYILAVALVSPYSRFELPPSYFCLSLNDIETLYCPNYPRAGNLPFINCMSLDAYRNNIDKVSHVKTTFFNRFYCYNFPFKSLNQSKFYSS